MIPDPTAGWAAAGRNAPPTQPRSKKPRDEKLIERGLPKSWREIIWNPPVHRGASGAFLDSTNDGNPDYVGTGSAKGSAVTYREEIMGPDRFNKVRKLRKGVIFQYLAYQKEWQYTLGEGWGTMTLDATQGKRYGFRFHYNPSTIQHGMGVSNDGVNPALIMTGKAQSMPITSGTDPATIGFTIYLNRIEDMLLIEGAKNSAVDAYSLAMKLWNRQLTEAYNAGRSDRVASLMTQKPRKAQYRNAQPIIPNDKVIRYFYGQPMTTQDLEGIYERGTMYDLEFLFRTLLGAPWKTVLRGDTADVGIAFGQPLVLDFNAGASPGTVQHGQRYLGRVSAISYNHLSFNSRMVPMWTEVAIDFMRYPDAAGQSFNGESASAGSVSGTPGGPRYVDGTVEGRLDTGTRIIDQAQLADLNFRPPGGPIMPGATDRGPIPTSPVVTSSGMSTPDPAVWNLSRAPQVPYAPGYGPSSPWDNVFPTGVNPFDPDNSAS